MNFLDLPRVDAKWIADELSHLSARYAHIGKAVALHGVPKFSPRKANFHTLAALIVEQQISVHAARAILLRLEAALPRMDADSLLAANEQDLRALGLSHSKIKYLRDLAQHVADGRLDIANLKNLQDAELIADLTRVKGIGRWSAENFMIFALGRRNVWPAHDVALQEGIRKLKKLEVRPNPKQMDIIGARYAPHRTAAALFGWHFHEKEKF